MNIAKAITLANCRAWYLGALLSLLAGCASLPDQTFDAGPLARRSAPRQGHDRITILGPLIERQQDDTGMTFSAVRPFWSRVSDPNQERSVSDVLWPIGMDKAYKGERDWRFFPAFGHDFDVRKSQSRYRWSLFPFLFGGRTLQDEPYFALFPLGGALHEFLGRDRIFFVLFPLYAYSQHDDMETHSVLWPIYSRTTGDAVYRWRIWPFYGVSHNHDRWTKRFVMWPFWSSVNYLYPDQKGNGFVLFPFYGKVDVAGRHSRMLFPPLFKYEWDSRRHRAWNAPWPLLQYSRGSVDKLYLWPFWGRKSSGREKQWFALWPLISSRQTERPKQRVSRFRAVPFVYYEAHQDRPETLDESGEQARDILPVVSRYFKLWPFFSYRREGTHARTRLLALWPLKQTPGIERNWAPLWSLYTRDVRDNVRQSELLWGLYRSLKSPSRSSMSVFPIFQKTSDETQSTRAWSLLYGLLGREQTHSQRQWRFLYVFRLGDKMDRGRPDEPDAD